MHNLSTHTLLQRLQMNTSVRLKGFDALGTARELLHRATHESGQRITFEPASDSGLMAYLSSASPQGADAALGGAVIGLALGVLMSDPGRGAMIGTRLGMLAKRKQDAGQEETAWQILAVHDEQGVPVITITPSAHR